MIMSIAISLACILIVTLSWSVLNWVWFNPKRLERMLRKQGFQGNPYKLYYGDPNEKAKIKMEAKSKPMSSFSNDYLSRCLPFYHHTVKKYGKKSFIWKGPTPVIHISEPHLIREVLMKRKELKKPQGNPFLNLISPGLARVEGEVWVKRRKLLNPAFHIQKLKLMVPAISNACNDMIQKWERMASPTGSCELDIWSDLNRLSADGISRAAFGNSYKEGGRIFELITQQIIVARPVFSSMYIPGWRFLPTKINRRIMQLDCEIKSLLKGVINKRQEAMKAGEKSKDDLLGILLESTFEDNRHDNDESNKRKSGMSLGEVIDECKIFYLAGQGTISILLAWTIIMLAKYQDWQQRARVEVLEAFDRDIPSDFNGLNKLKTVNMILQEVLRLYPVLTEIGRTACEDIKIGDMVIPRGVAVILAVLHVHHDEELWGPDAKEFRPERFNEGISKASGGNICFFSFGWGPRTCIGSNFAMTEARLALAMILQRFSFELSPSYVHSPATIAGLQPQFGAQIIFNRLSE